MKRLRSLGLTLLALFALGAITANAALAVEGALPSEGNDFTIKGGEQKLENLRKESLSCTSVTGTGTPLTGSDVHATGTLDFAGCKSLGFEGVSLGDKSGLILLAVLYLFCLLNSAELQWAVLIEPTSQPVHIEVPSLGVLILVKGAIIAELLTKLAGAPLKGQPKGKEFAVAFLAEDTPTRTKCSLEGTFFTSTYAASIDTKEDVDSWQVGEFDITHLKEVEFMDK